jgi:hypothetical protein
MDMKHFGEGKNAFTVSQVEVSTLTEIMDRKDEILQGLERQHAKTGGLFTALMVTDITELDSVLFAKGDPVFLSRIRYPRMEANVYMLKGILSRKKQLVPCLTELIRKSSGRFCKENYFLSPGMFMGPHMGSAQFLPLSNSRVINSRFRSLLLISFFRMDCLLYHQDLFLAFEVNLLSGVAIHNRRGSDYSLGHRDTGLSD